MAPHRFEEQGLVRCSLLASCLKHDANTRRNFRLNVTEGSVLDERGLCIVSVVFSPEPQPEPLED